MIDFVSALVCFIASAVFCAIYAWYRWWETWTGWSVMLLASCLALVSGGRALAHLDPVLGEALNDVGYIAVSVVMVWRTVDMWRRNHPDRYMPERDTIDSTDGRF